MSFSSITAEKHLSEAEERILERHIETHRPRIMKQALVLTRGDYEVSLDITQRTCISIYKFRRKGKFIDYENFNNFALKIVTNKYLDFVRTSKRKPDSYIRNVCNLEEPISDSVDHTFGDTLIDKKADIPILYNSDFYDAFIEETEKLSPLRRNIIRLRFLDELNYKEISEKLGVSIYRARLDCYKALEILRNKLKDFNPTVPHNGN